MSKHVVCAGCAKSIYQRLDIRMEPADFQAILDFAEKRGLLVHLDSMFRRLNSLWSGIEGSVVSVWKDVAPYSFEFAIYDKNVKLIMNGGLIYHGPGDSGISGPSFAVRFGTNECWEIHT